MSAHTPGPWRYEQGGGHAPNRIVGSDYVQVGGWLEPRGGVTNASYSDVVCENLGDMELPGPSANAHLIASAPDLLAFAEWILSRAHDESQEAIRARAAIAKAKGGAK